MKRISVPIVCLVLLTFLFAGRVPARAPSSGTFEAVLRIPDTDVEPPDYFPVSLGLTNPSQRARTLDIILSPADPLRMLSEPHRQLTLQPGEHRALLFTLYAPRGTPSGRVPVMVRIREPRSDRRRELRGEVPIARIPRFTVEWLSEPTLAVRVGERARARVRMENQGNTPLDIDGRLTTPPSLLSHEIHPQPPFQLSPGDTRVLTVWVEAIGSPGRYQRRTLPLTLEPRAGNVALTPWKRNLTLDLYPVPGREGNLFASLDHEFEVGFARGNEDEIEWFQSLRSEGPLTENTSMNLQVYTSQGDRTGPTVRSALEDRYRLEIRHPEGFLFAGDVYQNLGSLLGETVFGEGVQTGWALGNGNAGLFFVDSDRPGSGTSVLGGSLEWTFGPHHALSSRFVLEQEAAGPIRQKRTGTVTWTWNPDGPLWIEPEIGIGEIIGRGSVPSPEGFAGRIGLGWEGPLLNLSGELILRGSDFPGARQGSRTIRVSGGRPITDRIHFSSRWFSGRHRFESDLLAFERDVRREVRNADVGVNIEVPNGPDMRLSYRQSRRFEERPTLQEFEERKVRMSFRPELEVDFARLFAERGRELRLEEEQRARFRTDTSQFTRVGMDLSDGISGLGASWTYGVRADWTRNEEGKRLALNRTGSRIGGRLLYDPSKYPWNLRMGVSRENFQGFGPTERGRLRGEFALDNDRSLNLDVNVRDLSGSNQTTEYALGLSYRSRFQTPLSWLPRRARWSGQVFQDRNVNGKKDPDETGIQGVELRLGDKRSLTGPGGEFRFPEVKPGVYPVTMRLVGLREIYQTTTPLPDTVALRKGEERTTFVGVVQPARVSGRIRRVSGESPGDPFFDSEQEPRTITVRATSTSGQTHITTIKPNNRYEVFLNPGSYTLTVDTSTLSRFQTVTPDSFSLELQAGDTRSDLDFTIRSRPRPIRRKSF